MREFTLEDFALIWEGQPDRGPVVRFDGLKLVRAVAPFGIVEEVRSDGLVVVDLDSRRKPKQADWFCLRTEPYECGGCGAVIRHWTWDLEDGHLILVWPSQSDPNMRKVIDELSGKAAIVPYEDALGDAVSYYAVYES